jgi:hypothetical protein
MKSARSAQKFQFFRRIAKAINASSGDKSFAIGRRMENHPRIELVKPVIPFHFPSELTSWHS